VADILGRETVVDVLAHVVRGRQSQAIGLAFDPAEALRGPVRGFEFRFYRDEQSRGWETHARGDASVTVSNVRLDIRPVQIAGPLYQP
jgi:cyanophycinase